MVLQNVQEQYSLSSIVVVDLVIEAGFFEMFINLQCNYKCLTIPA